MKHLSSLLAISVVVLLESCGPDPGQPAAAFKAKPRPVAAVELPEPASKPWTPGPTQLPKDFVAAAVFLQAHGLADPRGGVFSKVRYEPISEDATRWQGETEQYGWVVKGVNGKEALVGMDGLLHTEFRRGPRFDPLAYASPPAPEARKSRGVEGAGGVSSAFVVAPKPIKPVSRLELEGVLFLIANEPKAARMLLSRSTKSGEPVFMRAANALLRAKWARAVSAHVRSDDQSALNLALELDTLRVSYESQASVIMKSGDHSRLSQAASRTQRAFPFLEQVSALIEDSRTRIAGSSSTKSSSKGDHERLEKTISEMDQFNPSEETVLDKPNYLFGKGIIQFGLTDSTEAANTDLFDRLIECLEARDSLVRRATNRANQLHILYLHELVAKKFYVLSCMNLFGPAPNEAPSIVAIKKWWAENRQLSPPNRVFAALENDHGEPNRWAAASQLIAEGPGRAQYRLLARHSNPSVSDLMNRRIADILNKPTENETIAASAVSIGQSLLKWDSDSALPALKLLTEYFYARRHANKKLSVELEADVLAMFEQRIQKGDVTAREHQKQMQAAWQADLPKALNPASGRPDLRAQRQVRQ